MIWFYLQLIDTLMESNTSATGTDPIESIDDEVPYYPEDTTEDEANHVEQKEVYSRTVQTSYDLIVST